MVFEEQDTREQTGGITGVSKYTHSALGARLRSNKWSSGIFLYTSVQVGLLGVWVPYMLHQLSYMHMYNIYMYL